MTPATNRSEVKAVQAARPARDPPSKGTETQTAQSCGSSNSRHTTTSTATSSHKPTATRQLPAEAMRGAATIHHPATTTSGNYGTHRSADTAPQANTTGEQQPPRTTAHTEPHTSHPRMRKSRTCACRQPRASLGAPPVFSPAMTPKRPCCASLTWWSKTSRTLCLLRAAPAHSSNSACRNQPASSSSSNSSSSRQRGPTKAEAHAATRTPDPRGHALRCPAGSIEHPTASPHVGRGSDHWQPKPSSCCRAGPQQGT